MKNKAGAGFEAYEYPGWSTALGWLIFVACIIPIPLVYIINYIKEYKAIGLRRRVREFFQIFLILISFIN
jgi:hypothetical protein